MDSVRGKEEIFVLRVYGERDHTNALQTSNTKAAELIVGLVP